MTSRREQKQAMREERLRREREAAEAKERRKRLGLVLAAVIGVVALVLIAFGLFGGGGGGAEEGAGGGTKDPEAYPDGTVPEAQPLTLEDAAERAGCKLEDPENEGQQHVDTKVDYKANPPTSGNHNAIPAEDGAYYNRPPPKENLVHSLEHGRVIIQFKPAVPDQVKGNLKALFDEDSSHMLITPNETNMPYEVAATAWDHSIGCPKMNDQVYDAIRAFKFRYRDKGPERVD